MAAEVFPTRGLSVIKAIYSDTVLEDTRLQISKTKKGEELNKGRNNKVGGLTERSQ